MKQAVKIHPGRKHQWLLVIVSVCSTHTGGGERGIILILIRAADIIISVLVCVCEGEKGALCEPSLSLSLAIIAALMYKRARGRP